VGCLLGGALSKRFGSPRVAAFALGLSGTCCLVFPIAVAYLDVRWQLLLLLVWGATVVADSPQFSVVAARSCPAHTIGSALALQNAIGFAITVISIAAVTGFIESLGAATSWLLLPGPLLGLWGLYPLWSKSTAQ